MEISQRLLFAIGQKLRTTRCLERISCNQIHLIARDTQHSQRLVCLGPAFNLIQIERDPLSSAVKCLSPGYQIGGIRLRWGAFG